MNDNERISIPGLSKEYIYELLCRELPTAQENVEEYRSVKKACKRIVDYSISPAQAIILQDSGWLKGIIIRFAFQNKRIIKRIPVLGNFALKVKERILEKKKSKALLSGANEIFDVSDLLNLDINPFVCSCYRELLERECSEEELVGYQKLICDGMSKAAIIYIFITSEEFRNRFIVDDIQKYKKVYRKERIKVQLKNAPVIGYLIKLLLLPKELHSLRIEYEINKANERERDRMLEIQYGQIKDKLFSIPEKEKAEMQDLVIVGAGGHARSVIDIILQNSEYRIVGCLSPQYPEQRRVTGLEDIKIIGTDSDLEKLYAEGIRNIFVAIGDNALRHRLFKAAVEIGYEPVNVISKNAIISPRSVIGKGVCVMPGAVLNVNTQIGDNSIINTNCNVDHDCSIGTSVHIAPGCAISGSVSIGEGTQLGTGTSVKDRISIGKWSTIGAGSVVVKNIGDGTLAFGVPAQVIR